MHKQTRHGYRSLYFLSNALGLVMLLSYTLECLQLRKAAWELESGAVFTLR